MIVYDEFKNLIPSLTEEEYGQLEKNILKDGIRDPIVLWSGPPRFADDVIVDGHNRYEIANKHNLSFEIIELDMPDEDDEDEDDVKLWIINNQFGRRNINNYQRSVLALKMEDIYRERAKKTQGRRTDILHNYVKCEPTNTQKELSNIANVSHDTIARVKKIEEKATPEIKKQLNNGDIHINKAFSEIKKQERKELIEKQKDDIRQGKIEMPTGKFELIVIDPPWAYESNYDPDGRRGACPYPTMHQEQLKNMDMPSSDNCIIWLWTTQRFIWDAKELLTYWGFEYKAILTWDKDIMGIGQWLRMQTEFCLLGIKGKPIWDVTDMRDILREQRREHSRKPEMFYELIDKYFVGRKLDYFSRQLRNGWDVIGNDLNKF